ncbi:MAG: D-alanine--D-alanine ligase [Clostridiales bacterium]|jgi:D-alanine-D-alanine ligase|nr:D-alanine--D-alanine ligase [Clostridiales bacterium]
MEKINVAVIFGGRSPEHEISKLSVTTILANMSAEKYNIIPVYITRDGRWILYDGGVENIKNLSDAQLEKFGASCALSPDSSHKCFLRIVGDKVKRVSVDVIFPALHGSNGEDGRIQGVFEMAETPYVGCGVLSSALATDKTFSKIVAATTGVTQARHIAFRADDLKNMDEAAKKVRYRLGYPCFVKPANTGSSVGVSKAANKNELIEALRNALKYDNKVLVEKAIKGRELECAALGFRGDVEASPVGEILPAGDFYDYDSKYNDSGSKTIVPADLPKEKAQEIRDAAVSIFKAFDCVGLARIDFFLEEITNRVIFNEINSMPGFTAISMYPTLWNEAGVTTCELIDKLIEIGLKRNE